MTDIQEKLFALQDTGYCAFQRKLIPTLPPEKIIGVRTPILRSLAKELYRTGNCAPFLEALPHTYFEENSLHGFILCQIKDYPTCVEALDRFLPYVDNWATCDSLNPRIFAKHPQELISDIYRWIASTHTYTIRFGIEALMQYFLDENFLPEYPERVSHILSEEYYVNMMIAWYFATALAKQYEAVLPYLQNCRLSPWVHNKTIQKACESYRITPEQKVYLRTLKKTN